MGGGYRTRRGRRGASAPPLPCPAGARGDTAAVQAGNIPAVATGYGGVPVRRLMRPFRPARPLRRGQARAQHDARHISNFPAPCAGRKRPASPARDAQQCLTPPPAVPAISGLTAALPDATLLSAAGETPRSFAILRRLTLMSSRYSVMKPPGCGDCASPSVIVLQVENVSVAVGKLEGDAPVARTVMAYRFLRSPLSGWKRKPG